MMRGRRRIGRPSRMGEPSMSRVEFRLTADERAALLVVAKENRLPTATLIREAVNCFVSDYREGDVVFPDRRRA